MKYLFIGRRTGEALALEIVCFSLYNWGLEPGGGGCLVLVDRLLAALGVLSLLHVP